ncbi:MAG: hypothetical protein EBV69_11210, partial [Oxalobacteraceae bacterium]|nr:hypothetical protein [Oxalobacteraceae bacterium]
DTSAAAQAAGQKAVTDYLTAKNTPVSSRSAEQVALLTATTNPKLGYNLDAWDGYIVARETILATALQLGKRLIVLSGDTHNAWHNDLTLKGLRRCRRSELDGSFAARLLKNDLHAHGGQG